MENPKVIIILGNVGSGKGTQAKLLQEKLGLDYVGSGDILRARQSINDFTGRKLKEVMNRGDLAPTAIVFKLWSDRWEGAKNKPEFPGFVIDGSPRKLLEAQLLDQSLEWYEWEKYLRVVLIDVSRQESFSRLSQRGREDDTAEGINTRLDLFEKEVMLVVTYYEKSGRLVRVNGEQSVQDVHKDIMEVLSNDKH